MVLNELLGFSVVVDLVGLLDEDFLEFVHFLQDLHFVPKFDVGVHDGIGAEKHHAALGNFANEF